MIRKVGSWKRDASAARILSRLGSIYLPTNPVWFFDDDDYDRCPFKSTRGAYELSHNDAMPVAVTEYFIKLMF